MSAYGSHLGWMFRLNDIILHVGPPKDHYNKVWSHRLLCKKLYRLMAAVFVGWWWIFWKGRNKDYSKNKCVRVSKVQTPWKTSIITFFLNCFLTFPFGRFYSNYPLFFYRCTFQPNTIISETAYNTTSLLCYHHFYKNIAIRQNSSIHLKYSRLF